MYSLPAKEGRDGEIKRMMDAYGDAVLRTAYMYLGDAHKAEDAFQEVFIRVHKMFITFRGQSSEKTWVISITVNVCRDMLRSPWLKRVLLAEKPAAGDTADVEISAIQNDDNRRLFEQVMALAPQLKDVVLMYYYHDMATTEISAALSIPEGTVRSRLARARGTLKVRLGGRLDFDE